MSMGPQVGSIFNEAVRDNTAKRWNGTKVWRTAEFVATTHRRYHVTGKSSDAAWCTAEPLLVTPRNVVFLCIFHSYITMCRRFVAFLEA